VIRRQLDAIFEYRGERIGALLLRSEEGELHLNRELSFGDVAPG